MVDFSVSECEKIIAKCVKTPFRILSKEIINPENGNFILKILVHGERENKKFSFWVKPKMKRTVYTVFEEFKKVVANFDLKILPELVYQNSKFLVFEDLTSQNFQKCENLDLNHLNLVLQALAKLHSKSLVFEEIQARQESEENHKISTKYSLNSSVINFKNPEVLKLISSLKIKDVSSVAKNLEETQVSSKFRRSLSHGNVIKENLFFKYKDNKPKECKITNMENEEYLPPLYDVLQLLIFNTSEDFRKNYYEKLLKLYHEYLRNELECQKLQIEDLLPYEEMKKVAHILLPIIKLEKALKFQSEESLRDLEEILSCPIISREDCYSIIGQTEDLEKIKLLSFLVTPLDQVNGYLGSYSKLKIRYFRQSEKEINCFVKNMPKNNSSKNIVEESGCFFKELFIYNTLIPQLKTNQIDIISECLPACYLHRNEEILVFDDLTLKNYKCLPAQISYDFPLLSLAIKKLANFHASILIFEEKMSKKLKRRYRLGDEYGHYLQETFFSEKNHSGAVLMQVGLQAIRDIIDLFPELKTEENLKNFEEQWPQLQRIFYDAIKPSKIFRNVVSHGDLWTNNIMVKFTGSDPTDCVFVDFQCTRYCPPAHDFLSVIFLTTDRKTRLQFRDEMTLIYYEQFSKILENYGFEATKILSFEEFQKSVEKIKPQMILQALTYKSFTVCTAEEIFSFLVSEEVTDYVFFKDRKEYLKNISEKSPVMRSTLKDCIIDLYDLCKNLSNC